MAWPKGKPRKGHVNKDGKPHAPRGSLKASKETQRPSRATGTTTSGVSRSGPRHTGQATASSGKLVSGQTASSVTLEAATPTIHGASFRPIIEPCPKCSFAYADGGYCPSCGWTKVAVPGRVY